MSLVEIQENMLTYVSWHESFTFIRFFCFSPVTRSRRTQHQVNADLLRQQAQYEAAYGHYGQAAALEVRRYACLRKVGRHTYTCRVDRAQVTDSIVPRDATL
jgi:hypothetical protein